MLAKTRDYPRRCLYKNMGKERERLRAFTRRHESKGEVDNYTDESQNLRVAKQLGERTKKTTVCLMNLIV